jgi:hypothetical protein
MRNSDEFGPFGRFASEGVTRARLTMRYGMLALLVFVTCALIYYLTGSRSVSQKPAEETPEVELPAMPPAEAPRVEVVVRTDVQSGELFVDGESYGAAADGRWVLDLLPGPHKLEAKAGGNSVTSSLVTVREGVPATVVLSMPEGSAAAAPDGSAAADAAAAPGAASEPAEGAAPAAEQGDAGMGARDLRRERRRKAREAAKGTTP